MKNSFLILSFFTFGLINSSNHGVRNQIEADMKAITRKDNVECVERTLNWFRNRDIVEKCYKPGTLEDEKPKVLAFHTYPLAVTSQALLKFFLHKYEIKRNSGRIDTVYSTPGIISFMNFKTKEECISPVAFEIAISEKNTIGHRVATPKPENVAARASLEECARRKNFLTKILEITKKTTNNKAFCDGSKIIQIYKDQGNHMAVIERGSTRVLLLTQ